MRSVSCPRCSAQAPFSSANPWRPFCSERCRVIDLGNWAAEAYRVPASSLTTAKPPADGEPGDNTP